MCFCYDFPLMFQWSGWVLNDKVPVDLTRGHGRNVRQLCLLLRAGVFASGGGGIPNPTFIEVEATLMSHYQLCLSPLVLVGCGAILRR